MHANPQGCFDVARPKSCAKSSPRLEHEIWAVRIYVGLVADFESLNSIMDTVDSFFMTAKKYENKNLAVNAKWTSSKDVQGWRQFRISGRRYDEFGALWLEVMAVCDRNARLWIPASDLIPEKESPGLWNPGWK